MSSSHIKLFFAEVMGTFILVVFATGSIVIAAQYDKTLGVPFIALLHFVGLAIAVYAFLKISMAHLNPAVTIGFLITKHMPKNQIWTYFTAEIIGAILGSVFVKYIIGTQGDLGTNLPNYNFSIPVIFGAEILATGLLMGVILIVVHKKGLRGFSGAAIGGIVTLDVIFFAGVSGASMNPARSLAPALISNIIGDLWLYWTAPFIGAVIVAFVYKFITK